MLKALKKLKLKAGREARPSRCSGDGDAQALAKLRDPRRASARAYTYRCAKAGGKLAACS